MAAPVIEAADCTVSGSNTEQATWAVSHPATSTGDLLIWNIAWDDSTTTTDVTEPAGSNSETLSEINATAIASASTEVRGKCWWTICTAAWSAGTLTFTPSATESWTATVIRVPAGEFDPADPFGASNTRASAGTADTNVLSPAITAGATDGTGTLVWFAFADADPLSATNPTGWTIRQRQDLGAVAHGIATRNTQTTNSESIAGGDIWTIAGDSWASVAYIVRGPPVYAVTGTIRFVGQTPTIATTDLGENAWAVGAWASGAWATGAWDVATAGGETVTPSVGTYRFVGQVPTVGYTHSVAPTLGTFRFVGQTPSVGYTHSVLPTVGTYRFVGQTPTVGQSQSVAPSVGSLVFVGQQPSLGSSASAAPSVGTFRFVGLTPTVGFTHSVSPSVGTVQFAGQVPVAGFTHSAAPTAGVLRFDGQAPSIPADGYAWAVGAWASGAWAAGAWAPGSLDATASPTVGTVRFVGQTPTVGYTQSAAPSVGTVRLDGSAPSIGFTHSVAPTVGTFRFDGLQPTVTWGDNMSVAPSVGSLVFVGQQPTVLNLSGYAWHPSAWASGAWAYGAWAPDSPSASVSPSVGTVRLVGQQPTLETGAKTVAPSAGTLRFVGQQPPLGDTSALVDFDTPAQSLVEGADLQTFRVLVRKTTGTNPTVDIALYEGGAWVADLVTGTAVTSEVGQIVSATWDAALLADVSGAGVQCFVYGNSSDDAQVEIGAVEWLAAITSVVGPSVGTVRIVGQTPTTGAAYTVVPSVGTVRFAGQQPSLSATANVWITPSVGTVRFGGYAPVLSATANQWTVPSIGTLRFDGQQPSLVESGDKTTAPECGTLRFVGNAPAIAGLPQRDVMFGGGPTRAERKRAKEWLEARNRRPVRVSPKCGAIRIRGNRPDARVTETYDPFFVSPEIIRPLLRLPKKAKAVELDSLIEREFRYAEELQAQKRKKRRKQDEEILLLM